MSYTPYIVQEYDRWDTIAHKAYGQPERWPEIARANPNIKLDALPTPGSVVWVPIIQAEQTVTTSAGRPPWK